MTRVRFAPSPTGYLHVGGARTALFNWLYARHAEGTFILRIEDTDRERSTDASIAEIVEALSWLGLDWDEYYRQTEREREHEKAAQALLDSGAAYEHEGAWWFSVPQSGVTIVQDELLGEVSFDNAQLKDFVIRRSDGSFVYNFVVVVDDADMDVSHVIRGDDHLNNTPKQVLLYQALGAPLPRFAHLPMILGKDRARLSKRHGVTSVLEYRRRGFLSEAIVNFLARLGWSHGDQELFNRDELVRLFSLDSVNKSAAIFDEEKLHWLNQKHMKIADPDRIKELVKPFVQEDGRITDDMWSEAGEERLSTAVTLLRDRCKTLRDLADVMEIVFPVTIHQEEEVSLDEQASHLVSKLVYALERLSGFTPEDIEQTMRSMLEEEGAKMRDIAQICRMTVAGRKAGPGLFDTLALVGKSLVIERLTALLDNA